MPPVGRAALLLLALAGASCSPAPSADAPDRVVIAHFGDSTCSTDYLPAPLHIDRVLNARLAERYPAQRIVNVTSARAATTSSASCTSGGPGSSGAPATSATSVAA